MASKLDLDIDDLLDDISNKPQKTGFGRQASPAASTKPAPAATPKKADTFDNFYDDDPVSEANVGEIAKSLDTERMDSKLFGKKDPSQPIFHGSSTSVDFSSTGKGSTEKTVIEKPMSAPGIRTTTTATTPSISQPPPATPTKGLSAAFDGFEVDSLLPVEAAPAPKPASAQGSMAISTNKDEPAHNVKAASLPLPDSKPSGKTSLPDLSSSGEFSSSSYLPSTGPTRSAVGAGKSVSFADDRPPTRVGKKLDTDYGGSDWLELAGGGGTSTSGRNSALDDILNATTSRRPVTSLTPSATKIEVTKPKSAPGGLDLDGESHRASQARGPSAGSAYGLMKSERDDETIRGGLSVLDEHEESNVEKGAPTPPVNLSGSGGSTSSLGTPTTMSTQRGRPTVGSGAAISTIILDHDVDIFSATGEFNPPLRGRRPQSGDADQGMPAPGSSSQAAAPPRQGTPPATANLQLGDALGVDASAVSELTRLVQLHNRESQLANELSAVRRHMDVNRLYLQRILGSVFGLDTPLPQSGGGDQASLGTATTTTPQQSQQQDQKPKQASQVLVDDSRVRELESQVAQLRLQVDLLQSIRDTLQTQHEQEVEVIRKSYQRQIDEVEQAARHKEERLRSALDDATEELEATRKRHADELTEKSLSQKSEIERIMRERDDHVRQMQNQHRQEMIELRRAHEEQVSLLRAERRADAAAAGTAPELKILADHLAELESNVSQRNDSAMSLKMVMFSDREAQFRTQEASLAKEREQIRQALLQLEQAKNELQQQRWLSEQREAKLTAMQTALEEERKRVTESADRDRTHLDKMRSDMVEEHSKLLSDIFRDRQRLTQEAEHVEAEHRRLITAKAELQHQQTVSSQTVAQARQAEEKMQAETSKLLADREKLLAELRVLDEERVNFGRVKQEIEEQRRAADAKMRDAEIVAAKGREAMSAADAIRAEIFDLKQEIAQKQAALNEAQSGFVEEQNRFNKDRSELDQLRRTFVCSQCQRGVSAGEVKKVMFENSPSFVDVRDQMQSLEQKLTADLRQTQAERDTDPAAMAAAVMPNVVAVRKVVARTHHKRHPGKDEFDYEAERAWLSQLQRFRIQSTLH